MKKAALSIIEQLIMLLVFAVAAALCLQAFVKSDALSRRSEARDRGAALCQSAAEAVRAAGGDFAAAAAFFNSFDSDSASSASSAYVSNEDSFMVSYDGDWKLSEGTVRYTLGASRVDSGVPGLGKATVWLRDEAAEEKDGELFRIEVAWQEVRGDG